ncbi:methylated-DNA--[protein]-cysteine S-methyltransferase [Corynebacterium sp. c24Ua_83]|uniref:methylated-DNA--[protein]-cysteine S-methyltransferase n=1 Tax=unclassified Corynebacterium TaxID=2624378 RepID=UPI001EF2A95C|nr:methylated-DNA--[protein]-cysteine S-methyltransferase [uncultured Corynebacterium sp.]MCG7456613.1 methylated-DNA--[protein]-cysteine S-methyltransferase [Corynebacterium sp. ACRPH]
MADLTGQEQTGVGGVVLKFDALKSEVFPRSELLALATERGLVAIEFAHLRQGSGAAEWQGRELPPAEGAAAQHLEEAVRQLGEYLAGERRDFTVPVDLGGVTTPFRRRATQALAQIPYGETITYAQLAALAGNPRAVRAAASACARNPLPILYPCHRVIRSDGSLGEYRGGTETKRALLEMERAL